MGAFEPIDGKSTKWAGLWWHPECNGFYSSAISLADLRKFKGAVRLYVRKNKFFNNGENGRPNYCFCFRDSKAEQFINMDLDEGYQTGPSKKDGIYYDDDGNRLFTRSEVRRIINGTVRDVEYGTHDPYDILPEDFL